MTWKDKLAIVPDAGAPFKGEEGSDRFSFR